MAVIKPNANFYSLAGISVHENRCPEYNEYRRCWMENPSHFILRDFPMHLDIESTSRCNLKCTFCDKLPLLRKEDIGDIDIGLYKKIIDEAAGHNLWAVKLSYRGEPLLHKDIVEMVAYAKKKGVLDVYFNTNGMLLTEQMCARLIEAGLDRISISIEGVDPRAFERERIGARFEVILKNIDSLLELRKKQMVSHPRVRIQTIFTSGFDPNEYREFWSAHSDEVAAVDYKDESHRKQGIEYDWACPQLWQRMTIEWNGAIMPCNNDDLYLLAVGNVKEKTVYECWHDQRVENVRNLHRRGQSHKVAACDGCPWRTTQIGKLRID